MTILIRSILVLVTVLVNKSVAFSLNSLQASTRASSSKFLSPGQLDSDVSSMKKMSTKTLQNIMTGTLVGLLVGAKSANAGFFQSSEQDAIDEIAKFRTPVNDLLQQLSPQMLPNAIGVFAPTQVLKGTKDDCDVVLSYLEVYIKPLQTKMKKTAPTLKLDQKSQERLEVLPNLMIGHMLELSQAINGRKVDDQKREVEEVVETLEEFLALASAKYNVPPLPLSRPLTDSELFGPLGCEFWGKERVPGSNACTEKTK
eukprot:gene10323-21542_t